MSSVPLSASTGVTAHVPAHLDETAHEAVPASLSVAPEPGPRRFVALKALLHNPAAVLGALILVGMTALALLAPWLFPGDPLDMVAQPLLWPGQDAAYPLGSDSLGRDVLAGIAHGARVSLAVGVVAAVLSLLIGIVVGATAGYLGLPRGGGR